MNDETQDRVRSNVRDHYAKVASSRASSGGCSPGCCGATPSASLQLGYSSADVAAVPEGANMGLGCGNPTAIAKLRSGQTVLDLGSGGGFDCFLAAREVGATGRVIGVDMTAEMVTKARANARKLAADNIEFRLGEIENLPVADDTVDVILSNCVINLSPDKPRAFAEAFRVLKPGATLAISDVVATAALPVALREDEAALSGCIAGAVTVDALDEMLRQAGFVNVDIRVREDSRAFIGEWLPGSGVERYVASATIEATKPATKAGACCGADCCKEEVG